MTIIKYNSVNKYLIGNFEYLIMKEKITIEKDYITTICTDMDLDDFLQEIKDSKQEILEMYPEAEDLKIKFERISDNATEVFFSYRRYETTLEYKRHMEYKREIIDKACTWLKQNVQNFCGSHSAEQCLVFSFRKAME